MHYTAEVLDRATGDLKEVSLGEWITVTELGELYGVGRRKVRSILHHMCAFETIVIMASR